MSTQKKKQIVIIGFGRFGRLLAGIISPFGDIHIISHKKIRGLKQIEYSDISRMDWIFLAVPISALEESLDRIKPVLKTRALVIDVCSVKEYPCRLMKKILPRDVEIIGTHPMFGPDSAKHGLDGLQVVVCPVRSSRKTVDELKSVFRKLNLKIIETTAAEHDRQTAKSLALVHFIGRGLGKSDVVGQAITTMGFERLLAVSDTVNNDTWQLFLDMQNYNKYSKNIRRSFLSALGNIDKQISEDEHKRREV